MLPAGVVMAHTVPTTPRARRAVPLTVETSTPMSAFAAGGDASPMCVHAGTQPVAWREASPMRVQQHVNVGASPTSGAESPLGLRILSSRFMEQQQRSTRALTPVRVVRSPCSPSAAAIGLPSSGGSPVAALWGCTAALSGASPRSNSTSSLRRPMSQCRRIYAVAATSPLTPRGTASSRTSLGAAGGPCGRDGLSGHTEGGAGSPERRKTLLKL